MTKEEKKIYKKAYDIANRERIALYGKEYRAIHKNEREKIHIAYYAVHRKDIIAYGTEYNAKHKEERAKYKKEYDIAHKEHIKAQGKEYRISNKDKIKERMKRYIATRRCTDERYALDLRMTHSIWQSLRHNGGDKSGQRWKSLVGYTLEELKIHLEKRFKKGMSWKLFLKGEIHIDHKIPKSVFNYSSITDLDFKRCWALSNLQPMWAKDNRKKRDKLDKPFQPSLKITI